MEIIILSFERPVLWLACYGYFGPLFGMIETESFQFGFPKAFSDNERHLCSESVDYSTSFHRFDMWVYRSSRLTSHKSTNYQSENLRILPKKRKPFKMKRSPKLGPINDESIQNANGPPYNYVPNINFASVDADHLPWPTCWTGKRKKPCY